MSLLEIDDLHLEFDTVDGPVHALRGLSYSVEPGGSLGIVGESGSGKTVSALATMGLLADNGRITGGKIVFDGQDITRATPQQMQALRGERISMIFQDPMTALNPVVRVGTQIGETIKYHHPSVTPTEIERRVVETLESVGVPDASRRARQYPHQWSGGMRQRAVISMAIINKPDLIIADEPTTALDATVQAQVLDLLFQVRRDQGCAVMLISHDLGVVREIADDVLVMYAGAAAEHAPVEAVFDEPRHPYTRALIKARPGWGPRTERLFTIAGRPPDLLREPQECPFSPRCTEHENDPACFSREPELRQLAPGHLVACHRAEVLKGIDEALSGPRVGESMHSSEEEIA